MEMFFEMTAEHTKAYCMHEGTNFFSAPRDTENFHDEILHSDDN